MEKCSGLDAVHNLWEQMWQSPRTTTPPTTSSSRTFISGGRRTKGREAFKRWAEDQSLEGRALPQRQHGTSLSSSVRPLPLFVP